MSRWSAVPPRSSVISTAMADTSTPRTSTPRSASAAVNRPGSAPDVHGRSRAQFEESLVSLPIVVSRSVSTQPPVDVEWSTDACAVRDPAGLPRRDHPVDDVGCHHAVAYPAERLEHHGPGR